MISVPPSLWEEFEQVVPAGERSPLICQLLTRELKRRRQKEPQPKGTITGEES
jgi:metal-responsive CopG/Arc/MetJ family transcriptional regulator